MKRTARYDYFPLGVVVFLATCLTLLASGCASDSHAAKGAAKGGATGAVAGAVGGLFSALVFGGDPVERAARGAVYGGASGAVAGAIVGNDADERAKEQQEDDLDKLRRELGDDAFEGLAALAEFQYDVSLRQAAKAQQSENPNYTLAGLWLEVLSYADQRNEAKARGLFPSLVEKDWNIKTEAEAEAAMRKALAELMDIRKEYDLPQVKE